MEKITYNSMRMMCHTRKHDNSFGHDWMIRDYVRMPEAPHEPLRISGGCGLEYVYLIKRDGTRIRIKRDKTPLYVFFKGASMCKTQEELNHAWDYANEI